MQFIGRVLTVVSALAIIGGCAHHVEIDPDAFDMHPINEFSTSNSMSLINTQTNSEGVLYMTNPLGHKYYANFQEWTHAAIEIADRELEKRGASIIEDAPSYLNLSIADTSVDLSSNAYGRQRVHLDVTTGDGYSRRYTGEAHGIHIFRLANSAVMDAVANMLRDDRIIKYITK